MKIGGTLTLAGFSFVIALAASMFVGTKIVAAQPTTGLGPFKDALQTERRETMPHNISTLLTRNLQKMEIIGFMRGLANDVANAVLPGLTNTLAIAPQSEEQKRGTWEQQAIKRMAEPEDVTER
jgi:hypothetical protein